MKIHKNMKQMEKGRRKSKRSLRPALWQLELEFRLIDKKNLITLWDTTSMRRTPISYWSQPLLHSDNHQKYYFWIIYCIFALLNPFFNWIFTVIGVDATKLKILHYIQLISLTYQCSSANCTSHLQESSVETLFRLSVLSRNPVFL